MSSPFFELTLFRMVVLCSFPDLFGTDGQIVFFYKYGILTELNHSFLYICILDCLFLGRECKDREGAHSFITLEDRPGLVGG